MIITIRDVPINFNSIQMRHFYVELNTSTRDSYHNTNKRLSDDYANLLCSILSNLSGLTGTGYIGGKSIFSAEDERNFILYFRDCRNYYGFRWALIIMKCTVIRIFVDEN